MQYNSTGTSILASYNDDDLYTINAKTGESNKLNLVFFLINSIFSNTAEHRYQGHRNSATVKGCSWFGDNYVVSGSDDGYVYGWDVNSEHIVMSLYADENGVVKIQKKRL